jgi:VanZ family protein
MPLTRSTWAVLAVAWSALVWASLALPPPAGLPSLTALPEWLQPLSDKIGHALLFGVQALLLHRSLRPPAPFGEAVGPRRPLLAALVIALTYGAITEIYQLFVPGRDGSVADLVADGAGALAYGVLTRVVRRPPRPA